MKELNAIASRYFTLCMTLIKRQRHIPLVQAAVIGVSLMICSTQPLKGSFLPLTPGSRSLRWYWSTYRHYSAKLSFLFEKS